MARLRATSYQQHSAAKGAEAAGGQPRLQRQLAGLGGQRRLLPRGGGCPSRTRTLRWAPLPRAGGRVQAAASAAAAREPLEGSTPLHSTRYLSLRDSDGARRILEVSTGGK